MHYPTRHPLPTLEDRIVAHLSFSPATRSQLCEALDTSRTNLGRALTTLLDEGSVVPVRSNAPGRGRPTQLLTLNASAAHAVGLLVTRTSCAAVMLSRSGTVLASAHIVSPASPTLLGCLEQTCEALSASATSQGIDVSRVRAVGVGAPIPMGRHARVASDAYPSVEDVASVTGRWWQAVPVVDNTVRMAAFAEGLWGAGSGMSSFIYLRLDPAEMNNVYTVPVYDDIRRELATNLYLQLRERGDHSFAKWMAAMTDFDIPLVNTARSDLDEVTSD